MKRRTTGRRSLFAEILESRQMLAGNVAVVKSGTTLTITGTGGANDVVVVGDPTPGTYHVYGIDADASGDNTLINGVLHDFAEGSRDYTGIRNITVNLLGGKDSFVLTNVPASDAANKLNNVTINTQAGDDVVVVGEVDGGELFFEAGFDSDIVDALGEVSGSVDLAGNLTVDTSDGKDLATDRGVTSVGIQKFLLGAGNDVFQTADSTALDFFVNFGAGQATASGGGLNATRDFTLLAANGVNSFADISIEGLTVARTAKITLGAGQADLALQEGTVGGDLLITTGNAANRTTDILVFDIAVTNLASIVTGAGNDSIDFYNSAADVLSIVTSAGDDEVEVSTGEVGVGETIARVAVIDTGKGKDHVKIGSNETTFAADAAFDYLTVLLGVNEDCLEMGATTVNKGLVLNGGLATDNFDDNGGNNLPPVGPKNIQVLFETFDDCSDDEESPS